MTVLASEPLSVRSNSELGRGTLRDPELDRQLAESGYAVTPLLGEDAVRDILELYFSIVPDDDYGLTIDHLRHDRSVMRELAAMMAPYWERYLPQLFLGHRPVLATFVTKHPGPLSHMFLHDDRTYVDERVTRSHTLWIPLAAVGPGIDNGGLELVPGSHRLAVGLSGTNTPDLCLPFEEVLRPMLRPVTAGAGDAVVYDTRVLHASAANMTATARVAVACAVAPLDAPLIQVVATGRRRRVVYAVDEQFFLDHQPRDVEGAIPERYAVIGEYEDETVLDAARVAEVLGLAACPEARPVVPSDVAANRTSVASLPIQGLDTLLPVASTDRVASAAVCGPPGRGTSALELVQHVGGLGLAPLRRRWRSVTTGALEELAGLGALPRTTRDATLLVLDPGARGTVRPPARRGTRYEFHVVESPAVRSGMWCADVIGCLDPGVRFETVPGEPVHFWNDGPGPLVIVATASPKVRGRTISTANGPRPAGTLDEVDGLHGVRREEN